MKTLNTLNPVHRKIFLQMNNWIKNFRRKNQPAIHNIFGSWGPRYFRRFFFFFFFFFSPLLPLWDEAYPFEASVYFDSTWFTWKRCEKFFCLQELCCIIIACNFKNSTYLLTFSTGKFPVNFYLFTFISIYLWAI